MDTLCTIIGVQCNDDDINLYSVGDYGVWFGCCFVQNIFTTRSAIVVLLWSQMLVQFLGKTFASGVVVVVSHLSSRCNRSGDVQTNRTQHTQQTNPIMH